MRVLFIVFLSINGFLNIKAQNDLAPNDLIKSYGIIESTASLSDENAILKVGVNAKNTSHCIFDKNENIIEYKGYDVYGELYDISFYVYETENNLIEKIKLDPINSIVYRTFYVYDVKGDMVESYYHIKGELAYRGTYKYNDKGNKIEDLQFTGNSSVPSEKWTCKYDYVGNVIEEALDYAESYKRHYVYDSKRNTIEFSEVGNDGSNRDYKFKETFKYKFDKKGNIIEKITYIYGNLGYLQSFSSDGLGSSILEQWNYFDDQVVKSYTTRYTYNKKGNIVRTNIYTFDNKVILSKSYDYMGNMIEYKWYSSNQSVTTRSTKYIYDEKENWTKKINYEDDIIQKIQIRKIDYFD